MTEYFLVKKQNLIPISDRTMVSNPRRTMAIVVRSTAYEKVQADLTCAQALIENLKERLEELENP